MSTEDGGSRLSLSQCLIVIVWQVSHSARHPAGFLRSFASVRFGNVTIHVKVASDFGQSELDAVQLRSENDLTSQTRILLQHGGHIQHIILSAAHKTSHDAQRKPHVSYINVTPTHLYLSSGAGSLSQNSLFTYT